MKMPIYIAGSSRELERVKTVAQRLDRTGLVRITHPWWKAVEENGGADNDRLLSDTAKAGHATIDLMAVDEARAFVALWPENPSEGMNTELGYALGIRYLEGSIIVSGPSHTRCIFAYLAACRTDHDDAAIDCVLALAQDYQRRIAPDARESGERP